MTDTVTGKVNPPSPLDTPLQHWQVVDVGDVLKEVCGGLAEVFVMAHTTNSIASARTIVKNKSCFRGKCFLSIIVMICC